MADTCVTTIRKPQMWKTTAGPFVQHELKSGDRRASPEEDASSGKGGEGAASSTWRQRESLH